NREWPIGGSAAATSKPMRWVSGAIDAGAGAAAELAANGEPIAKSAGKRSATFWEGESSGKRSATVCDGERSGELSASTSEGEISEERSAMACQSPTSKQLVTPTKKARSCPLRLNATLCDMPRICPPASHTQPRLYMDSSG